MNNTFSKKMKFTREPDTGMLSEQDAKRYFSTVGFAAFALILIFHLGNFALSYALYRFLPSLAGNAIVSNLLSVIPLYGLAFPAFYAILCRLPRDRVQPDKMGAGNWFAGLCVAVTLMLAGNYVGQFIILSFEAALGKSLTNPVEAATVGQAWWVNLLFMAILAPILEELVFRKVLCDRLMPLGEGYAVVLSAVIFGLTHGNLFQFFYAFLLGALFAVVYIKTGRLRYSILYHAIINLVGGVLAPWLLERLAPLLTEESLTALTDALERMDTAALSAMMGDYVLPLVLLGVYELVMMGASICGIVFLLTGRKKLRLEAGLLPPPKEGRVANVFCNVGVAAALTVFALVFMLSLL